LRMHISPRTFESHRAEAMRKLGARNTADLVRTALLHPGAV
jgi:DNA-binding CsgD family transcriptional regulator